MTTNITIRTEQPSDYRTVETIHRNAFWNLYVPGADEHYIAHILRDHADFIPELDLVITLDGQIIGNIMYTKSKLVTATGLEKPIVTFGPV
ncbi:GCN5 family acetyltransferase, partial [Lacticaseibacillus rhamnosus]